MDECNHTEADKDTAIFDGLCPLCLKENNDQLRAQAALLRQALKEITAWWANWIPDDAVEQGGYDALRKARAALEDTK